MVLKEGISRKEIVSSIQERILGYNRDHDDYNRAYASFTGERASDIAAHKDIEGWLTSDEAGPCIRKLMVDFGMNSQGSKLESPEKFTAGVQGIPEAVNIKILSSVKIPAGTLNTPVDRTTVEAEICALFDYCASRGRFSISGGFVIGSKTSHCIFPELCPMLDGRHIAISLYNVDRGEYLPPGNNWRSYLGRDKRTPINPSPQGDGRYNWDCYRYTQAIAFFERIYSDWQDAYGNPGLAKFMSLDPDTGTTGVPRIIDKVLW